MSRHRKNTDPPPIEEPRSRSACQITLDDERLDTAPLTHFTTQAVEALIHLREAWCCADAGNQPAIEDAIIALFTARSLREEPEYYRQFIAHRLDSHQAKKLWAVVERGLQRCKACQARLAGGLPGQCPACAHERVRAELARERGGSS